MLISILFLEGCSVQINGQNSVADTVDVKYGNTNGNISNGGYMVGSNDSYIYSTAPFEAYSHNNLVGLFKQKDNEPPQLLSENMYTRNLNLYNDWIYYLGQEPNKIIKVKTDGSQQESIDFSDFSKSFMIKNDTILYQGFSNGKNSLYSMDLDGKNRKKINEVQHMDNYFNIENNKIYYIESNKEIHCVDLDGKNEATIARMSQTIYQFQIYKGELYIVLQSDKVPPGEKYDLYKLNRLSGELICISEDVNHFNVFGDAIYFLKQDRNYQGMATKTYHLYKSDLDGNNKVMIANTAFTNNLVFIVNNKLYLSINGQINFSSNL